MPDQHDVWNTIADSFHHTRKSPWKFVIEYIEQLPKAGITADLGCGNGRHTLPLAQQSKQVYAVDFSEELLKIAQKQIESQGITNVCFLHANISTLPLQSEIIDYALMIASLHNLEYKANRIKAMKELYRILKPGGTALLTVWNRQHKAYDPDQQPLHEPGDTLIHWRQHGLNEARFYHLYTLDELEEEITQQHFQIKTLREEKLTQHTTIKDNIIAIIQR